MDKADMTLRALRKIIAEYCASEAIEDGHLQHGIDGLAQTIERQAAEIERRRAEQERKDNVIIRLIGIMGSTMSPNRRKSLMEATLNEYARQSKGTHHE